MIAQPRSDVTAMLRHAMFYFASTALLACGRSDHGNVRVMAADCATCHESDYRATTNPAHAADPERFTIQCVNCHQTQAWRPALEGHHPNEKFAIDNVSHRKFKCLECHNLKLGPSAGGVNADCTGCHTGAHTRDVAAWRHRNVTTYAFQDAVPGSPPFCLPCHAGGWGFGKALPHPEDAFPITIAPHRYDCHLCHNGALSPVTRGNTDCVGCHDGAHSESVAAMRHSAVPAYAFDATNPHFCLSCHGDARQPPLTSIAK